MAENITFPGRPSVCVVLNCADFLSELVGIYIKCMLGKESAANFVSHTSDVFFGLLVRKVSSSELFIRVTFLECLLVIMLKSSIKI